jgi:neutral ceramidase
MEKTVHGGLVTNGLAAAMIWAALSGGFPGAAVAAAWKAGVATVAITPEGPMWMAGYGNRNKPSEGVVHDLYAKALALEDSEGNRAVIVTADLIGITLDFSNRVTEAVGKRCNIPREAILLNTSHTHCGPEVRAMKKDFYDMPDEWGPKIDAYIAWLETKYIEVIGNALGSMKPAEVSFTTAKPVPFSVSRRSPTPGGIVYRSGPSSYYTGGPRDDIMPVLTVNDPGGAVTAILFGYACHPITLNVYEFCGDYPGYAQRYIEEAFPGATALFVQGCAGQLVPNARYQIEYAKGHGRSLAVAVKNAVEGKRAPVPGPVRCAYDEIPLAFQPLPPRAELEETARSGGSTESRHARLLLERIDRGEEIDTTLPCPLQVMRFGDDILLVGLCGEPVAEYAERIKAKYLTHKYVWVAGYCTYEFGYLPTWNVWREGGYEAGEALLTTPFPGPFTGDVEKRVADGVEKLVQKVMK